MVKILRKSQENYEVQSLNFSALIGKHSILRNYCIQNLKIEFKFM